MTHGDPARGGRHGDDGLRIGRQTMQPVLDFVDRAHKDGKPFLLWYAPMMPHTPHNPPARLLARYEKAGLPEAQAKYLAMVEWFDETVGQLVDHIESRGLAENTIFVYLADNGWIQLEGKPPLAATRAKMSPYDAGARTPIFIRWKGRITPRRDDQHLAQSIDLVPTLLKLTGTNEPKDLPGIDLTNTKAVAKRNQLFGANFVHTSLDIAAPKANVKYRWTIRGRWKLIVPDEANANRPMWEGQPETGWGKSAELYDLTADPAEKNNLAASRPKLIRSLLGDLDRWWKP
jgi:uncharacterized sulfatase